MYRASFSTPFFWIDDVYTTGLLPLKVKDIQYVSVGEKFEFSEKYALNEYLNMTKNVTQYLVHWITPENPLKLWNATLSRLPVKQLNTLSDKVLMEYPHLLKKLKIFEGKIRSR